MCSGRRPRIKCCASPSPVNARRRWCALLPDPAQAVCPAEQSLQHWLRHVYRLLREVGRIGVPGEPSLAALQDPEVSTPVVLPRETWLLERAGLARPERRS